MLRHAFSDIVHAALVMAVLAGPAVGAELPLAPKPIAVDDPVYPRRAELDGLDGEVMLTLQITAAGQATEIAIADELPAGHGFGVAAAKAVATWRFAPGHAGQYRQYIRFFAEAFPVVARPTRMPPAAPEPVALVPPVYPPIAHRAHEEGSVQVLFSISNRGRVEDGVNVVASGASDMFGDAAADAVRRWKFPDYQPDFYMLQVDFTFDNLAKGRLRAP